MSENKISTDNKISVDNISSAEESDSADKIFETSQSGQKGFRKEVFSTVYMSYEPFLYQISFVLLLGFIGRILVLGSSNIIGVWVDTFCRAPRICRPIPVWATSLSSHDFIFILSLMCFFGFLLTLVFRIVFSRISAKAISQIYDEVTFRTSRFPLSFFDKTPAGRIMTRFSSDYGNVFRIFGGPLAEFISILFDLAIMILLVGIASPFFLFFVVLIITLNYWTYRNNKEKLRQARRQLSAARSPSIAHFSETTVGSSTIRTFSKENSFKKRFSDLDEYYLNHRIKTVFRVIGFSFQMNSLSSLLLLITGLGSIGLIHSGHLSVGSLGVAFSFIVLSGNTVQMFFEWLAQFEEALVGMERLDEYLRKPLELGNYLPQKALFETSHPRAATHIDRTQLTSEENIWKNLESAAVEFKNVYFKYYDKQPWVLENLSFKISAGEHVGIIGSTGSGKSTIIQVLFQFYPTQSGEILIENIPIRILKNSSDSILNQLRSTMAYISQEPYLFQGHLRENLDMEHLYSDEELWAALERVGLKDWVQGHRHQLHMKIEERGKNLSAGEKQLICMARCLLQKSPIVIMDEATSFVDPQSEEIMVKATQEYFKNKTQIIIAHRLSTLEKCNRIIWLHLGKIKMIGPTSEILKIIKNEKINLSDHPRSPTST